MRNPFQFTELFTQYKKESRYSYGQLAELTGIPRATLANWGRGTAKPRLAQDLLKVAKGFNLTQSN